MNEINLKVLQKHIPTRVVEKVKNMLEKENLTDIKSLNWRKVTRPQADFLYCKVDKYHAVLWRAFGNRSYELMTLAAFNKKIDRL